MVIGIIFLFLSTACAESTGADSTGEARRLFEDLLNGYNKLIRPVAHNSELLRVKFKLRLSQLLDVHEKNQIMTTNVWLQHEWLDYKLRWDPQEYGNITVLYVPGQLIWLPDIVLYNNADGNYQITIMTKATVYHTGVVKWEPPAIYKSMCQINVQWFPFDEQTCLMKFGSWTYDGYQVDLMHMSEDFTKKTVSNSVYVECVANAVDLSDYYRSTEWDIIAVPGRKKRAVYPCCPHPYIDITYGIHLRRKTLFYTVNLIFPCIGISFLTVLVFYLPSDSGEKVTLSISILISLTVFFLLLVEIIPSTSLVIPLIGKYLLFTMVLVTLSICVTVIVINIHFRSPRTHTIPPYLRRWLIESKLPAYLWMSKPAYYDRVPAAQNDGRGCGRRRSPPAGCFNNCKPDSPAVRYAFLPDACQNNVHAPSPSLPPLKRRQRSGDARTMPDTQETINDAIREVIYIADHFKRQQRNEQIMNDWRYVSMIIDRVFLVLFSLACLIGTTCIILQAPTLYDDRLPIDPNDPSAVPKMSNVESFCEEE